MLARLMRHTICIVPISFDLHAMSHDELMKVYEIDAAVVSARGRTPSSIVLGFPKQLWLAIISVGAAVDICAAALALLD
jgi:hypothetical protein